MTFVRAETQFSARLGGENNESAIVVIRAGQGKDTNLTLDGITVNFAELLIGLEYRVFITRTERAPLTILRMSCL